MAQQPTFYPPKLNPFTARILGSILPFVLRQYCCVSRIEVAEGDMARLIEVGKGRMIVSANHPSRVDPLIVGELSRRANLVFHYVSAIENFRHPMGWALRAVGGYSIIRGAPDRASINCTRKLLAEEDARVVLFPEGDVYHYNETILPFHSGVSQVGFWALADMVKVGKEPYLPVLPIAVRYICRADVVPSLEKRIQRIEAAVGAGGESGYYPRTRAIGLKVVASLEKQYRLAAEGDIPERVDHIKSAILVRAAMSIGLKLDPDAHLHDKVRAVFNGLAEFAADVDVEDGSAYDHRLATQRMELVRPLTVDLTRLYNCMAVTGRVHDHPTYERLAELCGRLEELVFGKASRHHPRRALVRVGDPIQLGERFEDYKRDKRAAVEKATADLEAAIRGLLAESRDLCTPIPPDAWCGPTPLSGADGPAETAAPAAPVSEGRT